MKIEIEIPDWATSGALYILSGIELVAYKRIGKNWVIKTDRCKTAQAADNCGKCCTITPMVLAGLLNVSKEKDSCIFVCRDKTKPEYGRCLLGLERPFICCVSGGDPVSHLVKDPSDCTESFKEMK